MENQLPCGQLPVGFQIGTIYKNTVRVESYIAEGGQGVVYKVDYNGKKMALKWYKKSFISKNPTVFYNHLKNNVLRGSPSPEFLWPQDLTEWSDGSYGYIMELRPEGYYDVTDFMLCNVRFKSYRTIIDAALRIISAFRLLHNAGYCYQDLNDGNFFINPKNGRVLICDNDNVAPIGEDTGIIGKPRYMAPEVVMGKSMPNSLSDRFSMSVILYILFCLNHPLEGKKYLAPSLTPKLQEKLYGSEALFMMDPNDHSNGPHPKVHKNTLAVWPCLPNYVQNFFIEVFSQKSLFKPSARPSEIQWLQVLTRFRSEIVPCKCGNEIFTQNGRPCACERCGQIARVPFRLDLSEYSIPAIGNSRIYRCQLGTCDEQDALLPVLKVAKNEETGDYRIFNKYGKRWDAITTKGEHRKVAPEGTVPLKDGIMLKVEDETIRISSNKK